MSNKLNEYVKVKKFLGNFLWIMSQKSIPWVNMDSFGVTKRIIEILERDDIKWEMQSSVAKE